MDNFIIQKCSGYIYYGILLTIDNILEIFGKNIVEFADNWKWKESPKNSKFIEPTDDPQIKKIYEKFGLEKYSSLKDMEPDSVKFCRLLNINKDKYENEIMDLYCEWLDKNNINLMGCNDGYLYGFYVKEKSIDINLLNEYKNLYEKLISKNSDDIKFKLEKYKPKLIISKHK